MSSSPETHTQEPTIIRHTFGHIIVVIGARLIFAVLQSVFACWVALTPERNRR